MKKKLNLMMIIQWVVFLPLILPIGVLTGVYEGVKKTFEQATNDIMEETHSMF